MLARAIVVVMALVAAVALEIFRMSTEPFLPLIFGAVTAGTAIAGLTGVDKKVQGAVDKKVSGGSGGCQYTRRELLNGTWQCPAGWRDTGNQWGMPDGEKQCQKGCNAAPNPACRYKTRTPVGTGWGCEAGWRDTGNGWEGGDHGDKQCENCAKVNAVPNPACQYKTRQWLNGGWGCEAGWRDTGNGWEGGDHGDKQCEKC